MKLTSGNWPKVASLLSQVKALNMPGNIKYNMSIDWDTICGYEEWESSKAHKASMQIPEVIALVSQAFPLMDWKPEILFEGEDIC